MANRRQQQRTSRLSLVLSVGLHACVIAALFFFAAREGMLGKQLKKIAVTMVPKEKPPEKPKEKPAEPKIEPTQPPPATVATRPVNPAPVPSQAPPPPPADAGPPMAAPPPADLPAFDFAGGKPVETTADPAVLYKQYVEYSLRTHWARPEGLADADFVAEVEIQVDNQGRVAGGAFTRRSGNQAWDNSVQQAISATRVLDRRPPKQFPARLVVRFDVQETTDGILQ